MQDSPVRGTFVHHGGCIHISSMNNCVKALILECQVDCWIFQCPNPKLSNSVCLPGTRGVDELNARWYLNVAKTVICAHAISLFEYTHMAIWRPVSTYYDVPEAVTARKGLFVVVVLPRYIQNIEEVRAVRVRVRSAAETRKR